MRVAIIAGSTVTARPDATGPGAPLAALAWRLATWMSSGAECHLFACGGSLRPGGATLHYIPGAYGNLSEGCDAKAHTWYRDLLRACDVVHDLSPSVAIREELFLDDPASPVLYTVLGDGGGRPRFGRRCGTRLRAEQDVMELRGWFAGLYRRVAGGERWEGEIACG